MATRTSSTSDCYYTYALLRDDGRVFYIGKGKGNRWAHHDREARSGKQDYRCRIIRDIHQRGGEVIKIKIHERLTENVAHEYETTLISAIGRHPKGPLANLTNGGEGSSGWTPMAETRAKMAAGQRGRKHSPESIEKTAAAKRGQIIPAEMRASIAAKLRGTKASPETRAKLSMIHRGRKPSPLALANSLAARLGKKLSPEARAKMSLAKLGKKQSPEHVEKRAAMRRGIPRSAETRTKISIGNLGKKKPRRKQVIGQVPLL